jgi:hypothetical protein
MNELIELYVKIAKLDYWYLNSEEGGPKSVNEIDFWYTGIMEFIPDFDMKITRRLTKELEHSKLYKRAKNIRWHVTHGAYSFEKALYWDAERECCFRGDIYGESSSSEDEEGNRIEDE